MLDAFVVGHWEKYDVYFLNSLGAWARGIRPGNKKYLEGPWEDAVRTWYPISPPLVPPSSPSKAHSHVEEVEADAVQPLAQGVGRESGGSAAGRVLAVVARQA